MILVTGPTGSGKTTTLYGAADKINSPDKKIITIEDPVEYQLRGVNQIHVKPQSVDICQWFTFYCPARPRCDHGRRDPRL
jgi:type II secretory ATPase GspE/PulE/Tfp pilus assembly ATPase PilB-like protein